MLNPLHLNCPQCGGALQAKDSSDHGKDVRCPRCQAVFQVDLKDEPEATATARASIAKPAPRPRRSSTWLMVLMAVLLVGVAGTVAALLYPVGKPAVRTIDLTYLQQESDVVAVVKIAELMSSPLLADVMGNPASQAFLTLMSTQTGISPRQILSVTVGVVVQRSGMPMPMLPPSMPPLPGMVAPRAPYAVIVVRSTAAFDVENIAIKTLKGVRASHSGQTYFKFPIPAGQGLDSCFFPESDIAVIGLEEDIKTVIDQGNAPVKIPAFEFVRADQSFVLAATSEAFDINPVSPLVTRGTNLQALEKELKQAYRSGSFGLTVTNQIDGEVILNCRDVSGATKVKSAVEINVNDLKALLKRQEAWLNLSGMTEVGQLGTDVLDSITITQTDEKLEIVANVPEKLKSIISKLATALAPLTGGLPGVFPGGIPPSLPSGAAGGFPSTFPNILPIPGLPGGKAPRSRP